MPPALHSPAESSIARLFADLPADRRDAGDEHAFLRVAERAVSALARAADPEHADRLFRRALSGEGVYPRSAAA